MTSNDDERTALLEPIRRNVSPTVSRRLYASHFLSTWNSRVFEFGAVLYLAAVFPGTLLPMSLYALVRGVSAIIFAPAVGWYIDTGNRLQVVRVSIGELCNEIYLYHCFRFKWSLKIFVSCSLSNTS